MGKRKEKTAVHIDTLNLEIDYDKLADAIVRAQAKYNKELQQQEEDVRKEQIQIRNTVLGRKDYTNEKRWFFRKVKEAWNNVQMVFRILFIPKAHAQYLSGVNMLFRGVTESIFALARYGLYIVAIALLYNFIFVKQLADYLIYAVVAFLYAQIFRLVQFEVERIKDREYVLAIFGAIISVIGLAVSIVLR